MITKFKNALSASKIILVNVFTFLFLILEEWAFTDFDVDIIGETFQILRKKVDFLKEMLEYAKHSLTPC